MRKNLKLIYLSLIFWIKLKLKILEDVSPLVRKEAIEGLKKIKKKNKPEKHYKGKPEERGQVQEKLEEEDFNQKNEDLE